MRPHLTFPLTSIARVSITQFKVAALVAVAAGSLLVTQSAQALPCVTSDVSLTINGTTYNPSSCADGVSQGGGPTSETNSLNTQLGTSGFVYLDKSDDAGTPTELSGITFQVGSVSGIVELGR